MTEPTQLTPLSDPANVLFEEVVERPGFTLDEAYAFLTGADTSVFGLPKITVAGFWGKREEKLHPRDATGKFRHKLEGISQTRLSDEISLKRDSEGHVRERAVLRPNDILGVSRDGSRRIIMGPNWSGALEKRVGDDWEVEKKTKFYADLLESPFRDTAVVKDDEFFIPERVNGLLPQATRKSTPSQIFGELAGRFEQAAIGSHAMKHAKSIDEFVGKQREALTDYRSEDYKSINTKLHEGGDGDLNIDAALRDSKLRGDVVVWRGGRNGSKRFSSAWNSQVGSMVGVEYNDAAYASTSVDAYAALAFAGADEQGFLLKILAPMGTHGIGLTPSTMTNGENEILLDRGLHYRIVGDHIEHGIRTFDVEVVL